MPAATPVVSDSITKQAIGAYGERAAEAELIRHGWLTANTNASMKNAADFDIVANKGKSIVKIRVKTCGPGADAFVFGGFHSGQPIESGNLDKADFTILVAMGHHRNDDVFYIVPTLIVRKRIKDYRREYLSKTRLDGDEKKDLGWWTLHLANFKERRKPSEPRPRRGMEGSIGRLVGARTRCLRGNGTAPTLAACDGSLSPLKHMPSLRSSQNAQLFHPKSLRHNS